jgi:hypothetical protein
MNSRLAWDAIYALERLLDTAAADHELDDIWTKIERAAARKEAADIVARAHAEPQVEGGRR